MGKVNPHFFKRDGHGRARMRLTFSDEEASLIEVAAGSKPIVTYLLDAILQRAEDDAEEVHRKLNEPEGIRPA